MASFCINLNIHYTIPEELWTEFVKIYAEMPHWKGFVDGCPLWYGEDGKRIDGSVEPSGLQLSGELPEGEWEEWLELFKEKATAVLGYPIGEPEDGYDFRRYDGL